MSDPRPRSGLIYWLGSAIIAVIRLTRRAGALFRPREESPFEAEGKFFPQSRKAPRSIRAVRLLRVAAWRMKRKFLRLHTRTGPLLVAGFYICAIGLIAAVSCLILFLNPVKHLTSPPAKVPVRTAEQLFEDATQFLQKGQLDEAAETLKSLRKLHSEDGRYYQLQGTILAGRKDFPAATAAFKRALSLQATSKPIQFNLAELLFTTGQYQEAEIRYRELLKSWPRHGLVQFRLYLCCIMQKQSGAAAKVLQDSKVDRQSPEWFYMRAVEAFQENRKRDGRDLLTTARLLFGDKTRPFDLTIEKLKLEN